MEQQNRFKVVFVVGAGASHPYGFPLGSALINAIIESLDTQKVRDALGRLGYKMSRINSFRNELIAAGNYTIDDFLSDRRDYVDIGRFCVAYQIFRRESAIQRNLLDRPESNMDWVKRLLQKDIFPDLNSVLSSQYAIINFNYDRLFEILLGRSLSARFNLAPDAAAQAVARFPITHIHGSLGTISGGQLNINTLSEVRYDEAFFSEVHECSDGLNFTHDISSPQQLKAAQFLNSADNVVFLGFGFGETNLTKIKIEGTQVQSVLATCFGLKPLDRKRVETVCPGITFHGDSESACFDLVDEILSDDLLDRGVQSRKQAIFLKHLEEKWSESKAGSRTKVVFHEHELFDFAEKSGMRRTDIETLIEGLVDSGSLRRIGMDGYSLI